MCSQFWVATAVLVLFLCIFVPTVNSNQNETQSQSNNSTAQPSPLSSIYTILASSSIRPNSDYPVTVQLVNASKPLYLQVEIFNVSTLINQTLVSANFTVNPLESKIQKLSIGDWIESDYRLSVKGHFEEGNQEIKHETKLKFSLSKVTKCHTVFIQTDKAIYKPGQTVKFRAILVDQNLIPIGNRSLDIFVKDSKDNFIKQWKNASLHRGVASGELPLSDQPPLGDWSLVVQFKGDKYTKTFTIAEYVLPTFSVDLQLPSYATYSKPDIVATVKATYTYGQPVKGECSLTVINNKRLGRRGEIEDHHFQTKAKLNGSVDIPLNLKHDLNMYRSHYEQKITFMVQVEEALTGKKYNKTGVLNIYENEFKIDLIKSSNTFKPGLKYKALLKVALIDGSPVNDNGPPVKLTYGFTGHNWTTTVEVVPVKGIIPITMYPPKVTIKNLKIKEDYDYDEDETIYPDNSYFIKFQVEYKGRNYSVPYVPYDQSPSGSFVMVSFKNDSTLNDRDLFQITKPVAKIGQNVTFQVDANEKLSKSTIFFYQIMGRNNEIVLNGRVTPANPTTVDITILITRKMAPIASILVYYIRAENKEIVPDLVNFKVEGILQTPVQLFSSINQTKPGGEVDILVRTKPHAYVGLLGVDQSVLLLKTGNDITRRDISDYLDVKTDRPSAWRGTSFVGKIFDDSHLVIFTNALINKEKDDRTALRIALDKRPKVVRPAYSGTRVQNRGRARYNARKNKVPADNEIKSEPVKLRQKFPETWIWSNVTADANGLARYSDNVPDTITSWYVSAFAVDENTGLGIAEENLKINVFRPFFVKLSLPYSIIRGETISLQVLVFNYQNKPVTAEIVMENLKNEYDFANFTNEINNESKNHREKRQVVTIPAHDSTSIYFPITPKALGHIDIQVKATTENAGDALLRKLLIKPEGQTQYFNKAMFVKLDSESANIATKNFTVEVPGNAVPGSMRVKVSGISDILGSTVNHIDDLLKMPYGCGEQNMINLVPNIVVLDYLTRAKRLTNSIKSKALNHISTGYQRELTYKREDGSFSAFGSNDNAGSTWLTAYVVKSFIQARPYVDVDPEVVQKAIEFLFAQQNSDGSFDEKGRILDNKLQGGAVRHSENGSESSLNGPLTAYVLIAILHEISSSETILKNKDNIKRAEDYIYAQLSSSNYPYEIALITYALHLANSEHKDIAYKKLLALAKRDDSSGLVHWSGKIDKPDNQENSSKIAHISDSQSIPDSLEVETTAYALLTLMTKSDLDNEIPALRWLISKQNSNGGFASTQDTVIGLQALGAIAEKILTSKLKMSISIKNGNSKSNFSEQEERSNIEFNPDNALVLQQINLQPDAKWVQLTATGFGTAIVQVSYQYNIAEKTTNPAFVVNHQFSNVSTENNFQMNICTSYKDGNSSNMAVMEIELPSGYNADMNTLPAVTQIDQVKRADTTNADGTIYVYFDQITQNETCIPISADRSHLVTNIKPVPITVYDYHDRSKLARIFYEPKIKTVNYDSSLKNMTIS